MRLNAWKKDGQKFPGLFFLSIPVALPGGRKPQVERRPGIKFLLSVHQLTHLSLSTRERLSFSLSLRSREKERERKLMVEKFNEIFNQQVFASNLPFGVPEQKTGPKEG